MNNEIDAPQVRVVNADGDMVGVISVEEGVELADEVGLDLVEVSPNAEPPVCKILDYGKLKYENQKKKNEARKRQKTVDVKEVKFRPGSETHDYDVKMRSMRKFLGEGDKVKVTLRFRGREMAHQELGLEMLKRVESDLAQVSVVEQIPKIEGRQMVMVLAPKVKTKSKSTSK